MKVTFRKGKLYDSQMRLPETYRVMVHEREVAVIQRVPGSDRWFWYTMWGDSYVNTCKNPCSLEAVKAAVKDWFKNL